MNHLPCEEHARVGCCFRAKVEYRKAEIFQHGMYRFSLKISL